MYKEGDFVIASKIPLVFNRINKGDVVVFKHPLHGTMIKKVEEFNKEEGKLHVVGSHENSIDSREFGYIGKVSLIGKVVLHVRNPKSMNTG